MSRFSIAALVWLVLAPAASAQNMAPELMVEGTCEELVAWGSRPTDQIRADLDAQLGTETKAKLQKSTYETVMDILGRTPVSDAWFARPCTFSEEQIAAMSPLHDAYVAHMADKLAPK
ncbi:hypothetical protein [Seohaeicola zhoushanensis]|uniref:Uncharacterized protein n=1 Tax=Seohaeicola zhoushanensis TaxID=1569283 RepID=A0A8J3H3I7_9RHOB|nr:hypothetical protein [Seohaeicola zhoushanensis]GHF73001.1 hypothetical protein GCM10017056_49830 [Seohaeicola zhoushanensis]